PLLLARTTHASHLMTQQARPGSRGFQRPTGRSDSWGARRKPQTSAHMVAAARPSPNPHAISTRSQKEARAWRSWLCWAPTLVAVTHAARAKFSGTGKQSAASLNSSGKVAYLSTSMLPTHL